MFFNFSGFPPSEDALLELILFIILVSASLLFPRCAKAVFFFAVITQVASPGARSPDVVSCKILTLTFFSSLKIPYSFIASCYRNGFVAVRVIIAASARRRVAKKNSSVLYPEQKPGRRKNGNRAADRT